MFKKDFDFAGGKLTFENCNGVLRVSVSNGANASFVDIPKTQSMQVAKTFALGASEMQALTQEQMDAIGDRGGVKEGKQPF